LRSQHCEMINWFRLLNFQRPNISFYDIERNLPRWLMLHPDTLQKFAAKHARRSDNRRSVALKWWRSLRAIPVRSHIGAWRKPCHQELLTQVHQETFR
jgi:hypothetical protein